MHNKLSAGLPRTRALLLGLLLAAAALADVEVDVLGEMTIAEAGGSDLEASMHSSLLHDVQEAPPAAFPDSSAVVGRLFQMKVPNKMEDVYLGDIVKVSPSCM